MKKAEKQTLNMFRNAFTREYGYIDIYGVSDEQLASKLFELRAIKLETMIDRIADWAVSQGLVEVQE